MIYVPDEHKYSICICSYNYADDTTIACTDVNYDTAHNKLLNASEILLDWFESNNL